MSELHEKHCQACEGGIMPLTSAEIAQLIQSLSHWKLSSDGKSITRHFDFKNFYQTMAFINAVAWVAHAEKHHPLMSIGYNYCEISYTTHAIQGLSENDFICAAKIDKLLD